jgi:hypothetical protein
MVFLKRSARRRALVAVTLSASFLAAPQAQSFEAVAIGARHFFECFGLMLGKPAVHAQECLPNRVKPSLESLNTGGGDGFAQIKPPVVVPPPVEPPPVIEPPEPPEEPSEPCACGPCAPV